MNEKPLLYLAGGMYSGWQDKVKKRLGCEVDYYDPRYDTDQTCIAWFSVDDLDHATRCDWMIAYFELSNPSGLGLAAEMGIARAHGRKILLIDEHPRLHGLLVGLATEVWTSFDEALDWFAKKLNGEQDNKTWEP